MAQSMRNVRYTKLLRDRLADEQANLAEFAKQIVDSPALTLDSCDNLFRTGARVIVYREINEAFADLSQDAIVATLRSLADEYQKDVLRGAMHPVRACDPTATVFRQQMLSVKAEAVEELRGAADAYETEASAAPQGTK